MICPKCKKTMYLRRFLGDNDNKDKFLYECQDCGILLSPNLVLALDDDKISTPINNIKQRQIQNEK